LLLAKGLTHGEIAAHLAEVYGAEVSKLSGAGQRRKTRRTGVESRGSAVHRRGCRRISDPAVD